MSIIPQTDAERKAAPLCRGVLDYFPAALFAVAAHSLRSDRKHNPGNPDAPTWAREKSTDHLDCILRHMAERTSDPDYHLAAIAWRALAALQEHLESKGADPGAASRFPTEPSPESPSDELTYGQRLARETGQTGIKKW